MFLRIFLEGFNGSKDFSSLFWRILMFLRMFLVFAGGF